MPFLGTRIQPKARFSFLFNPPPPPPPPSSSLHSRKLFQRTLIMSSTMTQSNKSKRPICPSCSKPDRTCLCSRIRVSGIENSVKVTILHHALESKHPLNSTRIAKLGLKNLTVATVSDVNFGARFVIRLIDPKYFKSGSSVRNVRSNGLLCRQFEEAGGIRKLFCEKDCNLVDSSGGKCGLENGVCDDDDDDCAMVNGEVGEILVHSDSDLNCGVYGETQKLFAKKDFNLVDSPRKFGPQSDGAFVNGEVEKSSNIPSFDTNCTGRPAITFNIGNKVSSLSHLKLEVNEMSLYSDVRHQPKAGYLSTIESIVHALKAFGEENHEDLDRLLDTFEAMVGDQRRCKDERLSKTLP